MNLMHPGKPGPCSYQVDYVKGLEHKTDFLKLILSFLLYRYIRLHLKRSHLLRRWIFVSAHYEPLAARLELAFKPNNRLITDITQGGRHGAEMVAKTTRIVNFAS